jgi:hypothetical protein
MTDTRTGAASMHDPDATDWTEYEAWAAAQDAALAPLPDAEALASLEAARECGPQQDQ